MNLLKRMFGWWSRGFMGAPVPRWDPVPLTLLQTQRLSLCSLVRPNVTVVTDVHEFSGSSVCKKRFP